MSVKPALLKDTASTLTFVAPEGTVTAASASVALYDESGTAWTTTTPAVTISTATLTVTVPAALLDTVARNYRAYWTYTVSSVVYTHNQTFDCVPAILYQTLTAAKVYGTYYPILAGREFPTASFDALRGIAWERLHNLVLAAGKEPNRIIDPLPLEPIHAALTAALIARNYRPGPGTDWQQWADAREAEAQAGLDAVLAACAWYELGDDLLPGGTSEQYVNIGRLRMVR